MWTRSQDRFFRNSVKRSSSFRDRNVHCFMQKYILSMKSEERNVFMEMRFFLAFFSIIFYGDEKFF